MENTGFFFGKIGWHFYVNTVGAFMQNCTLCKNAEQNVSVKVFDTSAQYSMMLCCIWPHSFGTCTANTAEKFSMLVCSQWRQPRTVTVARVDLKVVKTTYGQRG